MKIIQKFFDFIIGEIPVMQGHLYTSVSRARLDQRLKRHAYIKKLVEQMEKNTYPFSTERQVEQDAILNEVILICNDEVEIEDEFRYLLDRPSTSSKTKAAIRNLIQERLLEKTSRIGRYLENFNLKDSNFCIWLDSKIAEREFAEKINTRIATL